MKAMVNDMRSQLKEIGLERTGSSLEVRLIQLMNSGLLLVPSVTLSTTTIGSLNMLYSLPVCVFTANS